MGRWIDLANSLGSDNGGGDNRDSGDNSGGRANNVPNVSNVPTASSRDLFAGWDVGVASLDPACPLGGYAPDRWARIINDCDRVIADFGQSAAALGWSAIDLFGFPLGGAAGVSLGGLVWRMDGGRLIAMDENSATYRWPFSDRMSRFARGYLAQLGARFVPVWQLEE